MSDGTLVYAMDSFEILPRYPCWIQEWSRPRYVNRFGDPTVQNPRMYLSHVRIYERVPSFPADAMEVLRDALLAAKRQPEIDEIIASVGITGMWLPSTIEVNSVVCLARDVRLLDNVLAHAAWNIDIGMPIYAGDLLRLEITNDADYPRRIKPHFILKPVPDGPGRRP